MNIDMDVSDTVTLLAIGLVAVNFAAYKSVGGRVMWGGVGVTAGGILVLVGAVYGWQGNRIRTADPDTVTDAAGGGNVMLEGEAEPAAETLRAPFTDTECLAYDFTVETYTYDPDADDDRGSGYEDAGSDYSWETAASGEEAVAFLLESGHGAVLVEAGEASLDVADDSETIETGSLGEAPEEVRQFLDEEEISVGGRKQRFREARLEPGETTFVSGTARGHIEAGEELPDEASAIVGPVESEGLRERVADRLPGAGFYVSDAPIEEAGRRLLVRGGVVTLAGLVVGGAAVAWALGYL